MSYILDALKKAERERGIARVPTLTTVHDFPNIRKLHPWILAASLVIGIAIAAVLAFRYLKPVSEPAAPMQAGVVRNIKSSEPEAAPAEVSPVPAGDPFTSPTADTAAVQQAASGRRGTRLSSRETAAAPDRAKPQAGLVEKARTQIQPAPDEEDQPAEDEVADAGAVAPVKPATLREAAEKMNLSILVYDEAKTGRLVFIDGRKYVEGDSINGLYLIDSITPDGAVLSHKGEKVLLSPGSK